MNQVGLNIRQLAHVVMEHPSLLQYSVPHNLQPKLDFFANQLEMENDQIQNMTIKHPSVWGRSLEGHIIPMATALVDLTIGCEDGHREDGDNDVDTTATAWRQVGHCIFAKAPELLKFHWKRTLEPKTEYLLVQCGPTLTRRILLQIPRALCQSLRNSLQPKLQLIQQHCQHDMHTITQLLHERPSLLILQVRVLERTLHRHFSKQQQEQNKQEDSNLSEMKVLDLNSSSRGRVSIKKAVAKRSIAYINCHSSQVVQEFETVSEAASHAGVTPQGMYYILNVSGGRPRRGDSNYFYQWLEAEGDSTKEEPKAHHQQEQEQQQHAKNIAQLQTDTKVTPRTRKPSSASKLLAQDLVARMVALDEESCVPTSASMQNTFLTMFVTARAYPSEMSMRGRRRSGGMAFHVPQFSRDSWRHIVSLMWKGQKVQVLENGKTMMLGYNYIRPSRTRCGLYAIRDALRAARMWIEQQQRQRQQEETRIISEVTMSRIKPKQQRQAKPQQYILTIITDSNYCLDLLHNETQILEWGQAESKDDFKFSGPGQIHLANIDILYPLARTFFHLVNDYSVTVDFRKDFLADLGSAAQLAAQLTYERV